MKYAIIIPARMSSSRFYGKPLAKILGKELISWVYERCADATRKNKVYIATDSNEIKNFCISKKYNCILTSKAITGTDRIYLASKKIKASYYINVQGDEPLIKKRDIQKIIKYGLNKKHVTNGYCKIKSFNLVKSRSIPKVVFNSEKELIYISRSPIPSSKKKIQNKFFRQVCIYSYPKNLLDKFGKIKKKSTIEAIEDIEIIRFLENGIKVKMMKLSDNPYAVDYPSDIKKVEKFINGRTI